MKQELSRSESVNSTSINVSASSAERIVRTPDEFIDLCDQLRRTRQARGFVPGGAHALIGLFDAIKVGCGGIASGSLGAPSFRDVPKGIKADLSLIFDEAAKRDFNTYRTEIVPQIAKRLKELDNPAIADVAVVGPYVNITLNKANFVPAVLANIALLGGRSLETDREAGKTIYVDYSSPNIGKSLHVGHSGSTFVGEVLSRIYEAVGYTAVRANYIGDWGTAAGKLLLGIERQGQPTAEMSDRAALDHYANIYAEISAAAKADSAIMEQARKKFALLEAGEPAALAMLEEVRVRSVGGLAETYEKFKIRFDVYVGEAFFEQYLNRVMEGCIKSGVAYRDAENNQTVVVDLKDPTLPTTLFRKTDGTSTYLLRDVAGLAMRRELTGADLSIYVVGAEQTAHLATAFRACERSGFIEQGQAVHVKVGLMTKDGRKISSREGNAMSLEGFYEELLSKARQAFESRNQDADEAEKEKTARTIALGAIYFGFSQSPSENGFEFSPARLFSLTGRSGLFLQYTAVRAKSLLERVGGPEQPIDRIDWAAALAAMPESAKRTVAEAARMPLAVQAAAALHAPHVLTEQTFRLAQAFNAMFQETQIRETSGDLRDAYRWIVSGTITTLGNALGLLNIDIPARI